MFGSARDSRLVIPIWHSELYLYHGENTVTEPYLPLNQYRVKRVNGDNAVTEPYLPSHNAVSPSPHCDDFQSKYDDHPNSLCRSDSVPAHVCHRPCSSPLPAVDHDLIQFDTADTSLALSTASAPSLRRLLAQRIPPLILSPSLNIARHRSLCVLMNSSPKYLTSTTPTSTYQLFQI